MSMAAPHVDSAGLLRALSQLARSKTAAADEAIPEILLCFEYGENTDSTAMKRRFEAPTVPGKGSGTTTAKKRRATEKINKTPEEWKCDDCDRLFSSVSSLDKHINDDHTVKRRRLVPPSKEFACKQCDAMFGTKTALRNHQKYCANCSNAIPQFKSYKCSLCHKDRPDIYNHYEIEHQIKNPEQILFRKGGKLVRSDIDTGGGNASWFIKEKESVTRRYNNVTCRLCEREKQFDDAERLEIHYTLHHKVDPILLNTVNDLFRAARGSHLGLSAASPVHSAGQTPIRNQDDSARVNKFENKNTIWSCYLCHKTLSNKSNLYRHIRTVHGAHRSRKSTFPCNYCDKVFDTEAFLKRHKNDEHTAGESSSKPKKCTFCDKKVNGIYKHYRYVHNIKYPKEITIDALLRSVTGTKAPCSRKDKAKTCTLKPTTCRLCEKDFSNLAKLEKHYQSKHLVTPNALSDLQYIFRSKKAHVADSQDSRTSSKHHRGSESKTETKCKADSTADNKSQKLMARIQDHGMIVYQCEECGVVTSTYDASIEHAQLHHLEYYRPITETCHDCKLAFEPFAKHKCNHDTERIILNYNPYDLLKNDWFNTFQGLPETYAKQIKCSSVYKYTRVVKLNSDKDAGIPLYLCEMCKHYVHPEEVEEHCHNNTCLRNNSQDYYCAVCDQFFYSSGAGFIRRRDHYKEHKDYRDFRRFRIVTFNGKQDKTINKVLREVKKGKTMSRDENVPHPAEESVEEENRSRPSIEIIENRAVNEFCSYCKKFIMSSEFESHECVAKQFHQYLSLQDDVDLIADETTQNEINNSKRSTVMENSNAHVGSNVVFGVEMANDLKLDLRRLGNLFSG